MVLERRQVRNQSGLLNLLPSVLLFTLFAIVYFVDILCQGVVTSEMVSHFNAYNLSLL